MTLVPHDPAWPTVRHAAALAPPYRPEAGPAAELDRQVDAYVTLGLAETLGMTADDVASAADLVRPLLSAVPTGADPTGVDPVGADPAGADPAPAPGAPSFLLVLAPDGDAVNRLVPAMRVTGPRSSRAGVSVIDDAEAAGYRPLAEVAPPPPPYLLVDVDPGTDLRSVAPRDALVAVRERDRTPLTLTEGVLLAALRPDLLQPNACWSLAGSRAPDQRVPAVWISERRPKLGWCWDGNPHTWLGLASAAGRFPTGAIPTGPVPTRPIPTGPAPAPPA